MTQGLHHEKANGVEHLHIVDNFFPLADKMRSFFDDQFNTYDSANPKRFVWDYWHVRRVFTFFRTPLASYFPDDLYTSFSNHLLQWGGENLGINGHSNLWLSYFIHGCHQGIHRDNNNGTWSFAFSLANWKNRKFFGGETILSKPALLDYWKSSQLDTPSDFLFDYIPPEFNRIVVFDSRVPHGVSRVEETLDPMESRLVIQGWMTTNQHLFQGDIDEGRAIPVLDAAKSRLETAFLGKCGLKGMLTIKFVIDKRGMIESGQPLTNTLVKSSDKAMSIRSIVDDIVVSFRKLKIPVKKKSNGGIVVVPICLS